MNWYNATNLPLFSLLEISDIYVGEATLDAPTPRPPMNLKNEKEYGSHANADPTAEIKKSSPMISNVFFLPNLSHGYEPSRAPITVPQRAIDIIKTP